MRGKLNSSDNNKTDNSQDIRGAMDSAFVYALFFITGACGLGHETLWVRIFTLVFGNTVYAVSAVLAAFMGGLGLGGWLAGRAAPRVQNPLKLFGFLEIMVGLYAAAVPFLAAALQKAAPVLFAASSPDSAWLFVFKFAICMALLGLPGMCMGASLPLLTRHLVRDRAAMGPQVSLLYALNTAGAVAGVLAVTFALLPFAGLRAAVGAAAGVNVCAGLAALALSTRAAGIVPQRAVPDPGALQPNKRARILRLVPLMVFVSGFVTMVFEVAWTRTLALIIGSSVYAFALMLVAYLAGTAAGGAVAARWYARRHGASVSAWGGWVLAACVAAALALPVLPAATAFFGLFLPMLRQSPAMIFAGQFLVCAGLMFFPALFLGVSFPMAAELACDTEQDAPAAVGRIYFFNTLGAIAGALLAGFLLIRLMGVRNTLVLAMLTGAACGAAALMAGPAAARWKRMAAAVPALAVVICVAALPFWNRQAMTSGPFLYFFNAPPGFSIGDYLRLIKEQEKQLLFYFDGPAATVSVHRTPAGTLLKVNGKIDASDTSDMATQVLLAYLPLTLNPGARDVLVIGAGSGATSGAVLDFPKTRVTTVEMEPAVVEASKLFAKVNNRYWENPRSRIVFTDGRNFLLTGRTRYDVIISEPSNPWMSGAAGLFTREAYADMKQRLAPGGLVCQWVQKYSISPQTLLMALATFADEFPETYVFFGTNEDLLLVGALHPLDMNARKIDRALNRAPNARARLAALGFSDILSLLMSSLIMDRKALAGFTRGVTRRNTDDTPFMEFIAPLDLYGVHYDFLGRYFAERAGRDSERFGVTAQDIPPETLAALAEQFHIRFDMPELAEKFYARAVDKDPDNTDIMLALIALYDAWDKPMAAVMGLEQVVAEKPQDTALRLRLINIYMKQHRYDLARKHLMDILAAQPYDAAARKNLADIAFLQGNFQGARNAYALAAQLAASAKRTALERDIYFALFRIARETNNRDAQIAALDRYTATGARNPDTLLQAAAAYLDAGQTRKARKILDWLTPLTPDSQERIFLQHRLDRLTAR